MARTTPDDVRSALNADASEYPDTEIQFDINAASSLVDSKLAPYANGADLTMVETFIAAHYVASDPEGESAGPISRERHMSAEVSYDTDVEDAGWSYWERAKEHDPTGRLGKDIGGFEVV